MAEAAEAPVRNGWGAGPRPLLSSGLQIEPAWAAGARRPASAATARASLPSSASAIELSAEAAAALAGPDGNPPACADRRRRGRGDRRCHRARSGRPAARRPLAINLHICPRRLGERRPGRPAPSSALRRGRSPRPPGEPLDVQPLIAYEDPPDQRASRASSELRGRSRAADDAVRSVAEPVVLARRRASTDALEPLRRADADGELLLSRRADLADARRPGGARSRQRPLLRAEGRRPAPRLRAPARAAVPTPARTRPRLPRPSSALARDPARSAATATALGAAGASSSTARRAGGRGRRSSRALASGSPSARVATAPPRPDADLEPGRLRGAAATPASAPMTNGRRSPRSAAWQEARLADIEGSASWRLTEPLRRAKTLLARRRRSGRG